MPLDRKHKKGPSNSHNNDQQNFIQQNAVQLAQEEKEGQNEHESKGQSDVKKKPNSNQGQSFIQPNALIQAKLEVGEQNSKEEVEADKTADQVVQKTAGKSAGGDAGDEIQQKLETSADSPLVQRSPDDVHSPSTIELYGNPDAMWEFLATRSMDLMELEQHLTEFTPSTEEEKEHARIALKKYVRLTAIGMMANHKVEFESAMDNIIGPQLYGDQTSELMAEIKQAAQLIIELEQIKDELYGYKRALKSMHADALRGGGYWFLLGTDTSNIFGALADNVGPYIGEDQRTQLTSFAEFAQENPDRTEFWLHAALMLDSFVRWREEQIQGIEVSLASIYHAFPFFTEFTPHQAVDDSLSHAELWHKVIRGSADASVNIDRAIAMIDTNDVHPYELPKAVQSARHGLNPGLQVLLDEEIEGYETFKTLLTAGILSVEIVLAMIPVLGTGLAAALGAGAAAITGAAVLGFELENFDDRLALSASGNNEYDNVLGVNEPSNFEKIMMVVATILTAFGASEVYAAVRGVRGAAAKGIAQMGDVASASQSGVRAGVSGSEDLMGSGMRQGSGASSADALTDSAPSGTGASGSAGRQAEPSRPWVGGERVDTGNPEVIKRSSSSRGNSNPDYSAEPKAPRRDQSGAADSNERIEPNQHSERSLGTEGTPNQNGVSTMEGTHVSRNTSALDISYDDLPPPIVSRQVTHNGRTTDLIALDPNPKVNMIRVRQGHLLDVDGFKNGVSRMDDSLIDLDYVHPKDTKGRTNAERMRKGYAPYSTNGQKIELHHRDQNFFETLEEVNSGNHNSLDTATHPESLDPYYYSWRKEKAWSNGEFRELGEIYGKIRKAHWKARLKELL